MNVGKPNEVMRFEDIPSGGVFIEDDGEVCMKLKGEVYSNDNAIYLQDGVLFHMPYDTCVTYKPTAKIVYKGVEIG